MGVSVVERQSHNSAKTFEKSQKMKIEKKTKTSQNRQRRLFFFVDFQMVLEKKKWTEILMWTRESPR